MLLKELKKHNPKATLESLSKLSGISCVTLYKINKNPDDHRLKLPTLESIYVGTQKMVGVGLTPDKYLRGLAFKSN